MKNRILLMIVLLAVAVVFSGCAQSHTITDMPGKVYGFWGGIWHGIILPIAWIVSLFNDSVAIYAVNNNGGWYDFGFIMGCGGTTFTIKSKS